MTELTQTPIPVAQYVRMSTDHQRYSIDNQRTALAEYATAHGMAVVWTYADEGRSGLTLTNRAGLKALLEDVQSKSRSFDLLLVYDISRWGRFQDADESAYYEYLLRRAGVGVIYCAEPFENDGSPASTILKSVKRAMAQSIVANSPQKSVAVSVVSRNGAFASEVTQDTDCVALQ